MGARALGLHARGASSCSRCRRATTFEFFGDARNLEAITPPWLHFRVVTPAPIAMDAGTLIEYRLRLHGLPIRWLTRIEAWEPGAALRRRPAARPVPRSGTTPTPSRRY